MLASAVFVYRSTERSLVTGDSRRVLIALSGVAGIVVNSGINPLSVLLILGGLAIISEWGYGRFSSS